MANRNKTILPAKWVLVRDRKTKEMEFKPQLKGKK